MTGEESDDTAEGKLDSLKVIRDVVAADGRLLADHLPAIYFDTSMVIDYQNAFLEQYGQDFTTEERLGYDVEALKIRRVVGDRSENKLMAMARVREKLREGNTRVNPISS